MVQKISIVNFVSTEASNWDTWEHSFECLKASSLRETSKGT